MELLTPLLDQFFSLKKRSPHSLLLFQVGDFYECYEEDARTLSRLLDIVLTGKEIGGRRIPMAGIPVASLDSYLKPLVCAGMTVAIANQVGDPSKSKGLVRREIVRIITPGTIVEPSLLDEKENNFLLSLFVGDQRHGLAASDVSTGELSLTTFEERDDQLLQDELLRYSPREILISSLSPSSLKPVLRILGNGRAATMHVQQVPPISFEEAEEAFLRQFQEGEESARESAPPLTFGTHELQGSKEAVIACSLLLSYLASLNPGATIPISPPTFVRRSKKSSMTPFALDGNTSPPIDSTMLLDHATVRNLELLSTMLTGSRKGSLLWVLDHTLTPMGGRLLKRWILTPLLDLSQIAGRQEAVKDLLSPGRRCESAPLESLRSLLSEMGDLERIMARVGYGSCNARDLLALQASLLKLPSLLAFLSFSQAPLLKKLGEDLPDLQPLVSLLTTAISPNPPATVREGGILREGYSPELDALKQEADRAREWIAHLEERERLETGIRSLKVGFNSVFGYYLEVTRPNLKHVPPSYIRKQTLVNAERFITEELKNYEAAVLGAQEKIREMEYDLFQKIRGEVEKKTREIRRAASIVAHVDVLASLAWVALKDQWICPNFAYGETLLIEDGRHPVLAATLKEQFIPNSTFLDTRKERLVIVTGPNMAGKSTYLRQVGLLVILAQMGSYIPARRATLSLVDRVFTRVGAWDDLHRGQSTFLVEMNETAQILRHATRKSLVLLDEIGRGTSTYDGVSIAWAIAEYLYNEAQAKTLFATHYHELPLLADSLEAAKVCKVEVKEVGEEILFLRKVVPGASDRSYGIEVAKLAGLPGEVVARAKEILQELESERLVRVKKEWRRGGTRKNIEAGEDDRQLRLLSMAERQGDHPA